MIYLWPFALALALAAWRWRRILSGRARLRVTRLVTGVSLVLYADALVYTEVIRGHAAVRPDAGLGHAARAGRLEGTGHRRIAGRISMVRPLPPLLVLFVRVISSLALSPASVPTDRARDAIYLAAGPALMNGSKITRAGLTSGWPPMDKSGRVFQDIVVSANRLYNMLTNFAGRVIRLG